MQNVLIVSEVQSYLLVSLQEKLEESECIVTNIHANPDVLSKIKDDVDMIFIFADEELRDRYKSLTDGEMAEFLDLAEELQGILPEGTKVIDEQTGAYNSLEAAIDGVIEKMRTQALLNAKNAEYETAIANIYDYEKKLEAARSAWENDADGKAMIDDPTYSWRAHAVYKYNDNSDEAAQRAFISEYFRTEYAINYDEVQKDLEENQSVIDEFEELYRRQYEDFEQISR